MKRIRDFFRNYLLKFNEPAHIKALSLSVGLFWGLSPFWGFHTIGALATATIFRLNKFIVLISSNISFPPAIPLVLYLSYKVGGWWLGLHAETFELEDLKTPAAIYNNLIQYLIGSFTLCTIIPALTGLLYYYILVLFQRQNTKEQAA